MQKVCCNRKRLGYVTDYAKVNHGMDSFRGWRQIPYHEETIASHTCRNACA